MFGPSARVSVPDQAVVPVAATQFAASVLTSTFWRATLSEAVPETVTDTDVKVAAVAGEVMAIVGSVVSAVVDGVADTSIDRGPSPTALTAAAC